MIRKKVFQHLSGCALAVAAIPPLAINAANAQTSLAPSSDLSLKSLGGISLPSAIDGLSARVGGNPKLEKYTKSYTFENGPDRISINVFKANFPNVGVWHSEHRMQSLGLFGSLEITQARRATEIAIGSGAPNAIVEVFKVGPPFASTAIATVGFGTWIVTVHSTSKTLDSERQSLRLGRILQSIKIDVPVTVYYPLKAPSPCAPTDTQEFESEGTAGIAKPTPEMMVSASLGLALSGADAAGAADSKGLTFNPEQFCLAKSATGRTHWYQSKADNWGQRWIKPISATGLAIEGLSVPSVNSKGVVRAKMIGALIAHSYESAQLTAVHQKLPNPVSGFVFGAMSLAKAVN